ncbi:Ig-like domain-containing protein [Vibrio paucivorans]|uniref:Uncharacterized protein n=1 Tax=Vibrio paucivorans TaxID=2829489 RepID=A0A9X3CJ20_9VIBR|nr:hypothetical protein [Vibrio paucivorans]MCW8336389.1 hypothetical protein [Vibrio paucivorans]
MIEYLNKQHTTTTKCSRVAVCLLLALLYGCGGDESSSEGQDEGGGGEESIAILAQDAVAFVEEGVRETIDLSDYVTSSGTSPLRLDKVSALSDYNHCEVLDVDGLTFEVETPTAQVCRFEYFVVPANASGEGQAVGMSQLVVSDTEGELLTPLSRNLGQSDTTVIDLSVTLPSGAELDENSLELIGETGSGELGVVTSEGNRVTYTAPSDTSGMVQIYYTAVDDQIGTVFNGAIYIAISLDGNGAPIAEMDVGLGELVLAETDEIVIDVADYVSDPDGDDVQLLDVYSQGFGSVVIEEGISTRFTYKPDGIGSHYLAYVVYDHRNGYAIGTLSLDVVSYSSIYDSVQDLTFFPTYTMNELEASGGVYSDLFWEGGGTGQPGYYPVFDRELAEAYCLTKGLYLPSLHELSGLYNGILENNSVYESEYLWPAGMSYLASDGSISLYDGIPTNAESGFFSCITPPIGGPEDYSFASPYLATDWREKVTLFASQELNGHQIPLPEELYELKIEIIATVPEGMEDQVTFSNTLNSITVHRSNTDVTSATLRVTDPMVAGTTDEVLLVVGLAKCPAGTTVEQTQYLACIPVVSVENTSYKFTLAIPDDILYQIGLHEIQNARPTWLQYSNTTPDYSYYDPDKLFNTTTQEDFELNNNGFGQKFCDILNAAQVDGRTNWSVAQRTNHAGPTYNLYFSEGDLITEFTKWMAAVTGINPAELGQGWLSYNDYGSEVYVRQFNQFSDLPYGVYQGGEPYATQYASWQYITCFSSD